jgi:hypothetical protein
VQRWGAVGAAGYQLGAYVAGDALYFAILSTPWFWRLRDARFRRAAVPLEAQAPVPESATAPRQASPVQS